MGAKLKNIIIADPYNDKHLTMFENYEEKNKIDAIASNFLKKQKDILTKDEYQKLQKKANEISQIIFIEENDEIKDYCQIQGEKDRKSCHLLLAPINESIKKRNILQLTTEYAFEILGMNDIFLSTSDEKDANTLLIDGFTNLGENDGTIVYLKEKEVEERLSKAI